MFLIGVSITLIATLGSFSLQARTCFVQQSQVGTKTQEPFRDYENAPQHVKDFYRNNHEQQTLAFVLEQKEKYLKLDKAEMTAWQAIELLDTIKDESDPDLIDLPQSYHAYQTAEAIRKDGHPDWLVLIGFIHDLGKVLTSFGLDQWAVVGDTYPVGCKFSDKIIYHEYFANNPDTKDNRYNTLYGIYAPQCGLDNVHMSWGHDEYLYQVLKNTKLPEEALYAIRYHSFYAAHLADAYTYLMNGYDRTMMPSVSLLSSYDLYFKSTEPLDIESLKPYYQALVNKFLPGILKW